MNLRIKKSYKRTKNKILNTFTRFSLSALALVLFFYTAPIFINFADKNFNNKEFTNNSKNIWVEWQMETKWRNRSSLRYFRWK